MTSRINFAVPVLGLLMTLPLSGLALARPTVPAMPNYDVSAFCSIKSNVDISEHDCVSGQYMVREVASSLWLKAPPAVRAECISANKWNDYSTLNSCLSSHVNDSNVQ